MDHPGVSLFFSARKYIAGIPKRKLIIMGVLFLVYVITARLGTILFAQTGSGPALIWAPSGISLAVMILEGYVVWPAIALGSLVNSFFNNTPFFSALGVAIGNTFQIILGVYILRRFKFNSEILGFRGKVLLILTAFIIPAISTSFSLFVRWLDRGLADINLVERWTSVWLGSVFSIMILTPLILHWRSFPKFNNAKKWAERITALTLLIFVFYLATFTKYTSIGGVSYVYVIFILLAWIALRFTPRWISLSMFIMSIIAIASVFFGPRQETPIGLRLYNLEIFLIIFSFIYLIISSIAAENKRARETLAEYVGQLEDALNKIKHHAFHDVLTGLPNRKSLEDRFELIQSVAKRNKKKMALMFLDMDRFKNINDELGHNIGDIALKEAARRLSNSVRQGDVLARLGGDEFAVILNDIQTEEDVKKVATKIVKNINASTKVHGHKIYLSVSIGIAISTDKWESIAELLKNADTALYYSKETGRGRYQFYDTDMEFRLRAKHSLEQDLRRALKRNELELYYQPWIDLKTGQPLGMEALVRWHHPKLGILYPYDFIPLAEDTGLIVQIGEWTLKTASKELKSWVDQGFYLKMAVNLSPRQFFDVNLVKTISGTLNETGLDPKHLELEVTESVAIQNINNTSAKLAKLKELGVGIAIDDFGTGYSSLGYLKRLPVQKLKVDRSFIENIASNNHDLTITDAVITMAHKLDLQVCAEGIEDRQQWSTLASMGCDLGQGFYICKPLTSKDLSQWLFNNRVNILQL